jgi:peptide/nickel transport system substrate-binding protein
MLRSTPSPTLPGRALGVVALVASVALCAAGCGGGDRGDLDDSGTNGARPATVRAHLTHEPASLSLIGKTDQNTEKVAVQVTDSLVQYDPQMEIVPRVAESWEFAPDGRTVTFRLRKGVRWHDGKPVTAADVVFTVEQVRDPAVESRTWSPLFQDLESVEAVDDRTLRARYSLATPDLLEGWRVPLIPAHLAESGEALLAGSYSRHPVGCGPFRFVRHSPDEEIVLEANDDYWDGRPAIDRLILRVFPEQRTAYQAMLTGELDIMVATSDLWAQALDAPQAERLGRFTFYPTSVWLIRWNEDGSNPFFVDPGVRRAMTLAVDREQFVTEMLGGLGRVAATTYHPDLPWTDPDLAPLPHDPDEAARLLDEAGWRRPRKGEVREREGRPFRFTLMIAASSQPIVDHMAAWLQQEWAEVGITAEIEKLEWKHYLERRNAGEYHAAMGGLSTTGSPDQYELYHSGAREGGFNFTGFADPEVDELLELGRTTFDEAARRAVYFRLQRRLFQLQPIGVLFHLATPVLFDRRLRGVEPSPLGYFRTSRGPRVWYWAEEG